MMWGNFLEEFIIKDHHKFLAIQWGGISALLLFLVLPSMVPFFQLMIGSASYSQGIPKIREVPPSGIT
jgi:hypothetical protein